MYFSLKPENFDSIVSHYTSEGFVVLTDVGSAFTNEFAQIVGQAGSLSGQQVDLLGTGKANLTLEQIQPLKRVDVTPELRSLCLDTLGDLLLKMLGPIIHVSRDFHFQFKNRAEKREILKGYSDSGLEVQALYGIHNEFTAARILVSPSGLVCWVPLNTYKGTALNLFPGTHRRGLMTNRWLSRDEVGRADIGSPIEYQPKRGEVVLFHFMTMHGSGVNYNRNTALGNRASCDIRFFPLCGIIDSEPLSLVPEPIDWIHSRLLDSLDEVLLAPLHETLTYCGEQLEQKDVRKYSVLHWAEYINHWLRGNETKAMEAVSRLTNIENGFDSLESYQKRFGKIQLQQKPFASLGLPMPTRM